MTNGQALSNDPSAVANQRKKFRNEELVTLVFEGFEDIKNIDLNKIFQAETGLVPKVRDNGILAALGNNLQDI